MATDPLGTEAGAIGSPQGVEDHWQGVATEPVREGVVDFFVATFREPQQHEAPRQFWPQPHSLA